MKLPEQFDIDAKCGEHLTYRDFIECSEAFKAYSVDNRPRQRATIQAIDELAVHIIDPLISEFGNVVLTYGFASPALTKVIERNVAPRIDQHAGHELRKTGTPVCSRLGQSADFLIPGTNSRDVAAWIITNLAFDRLYYYGCEKPIHVSYGKKNRNVCYVMHVTHLGRRIPRRLSERGKLPF